MRTYIIYNPGIGESQEIEADYFKMEDGMACFCSEGKYLPDGKYFNELRLLAVFVLSPGGFVREKES